MSAIATYAGYFLLGGLLTWLSGELKSPFLGNFLSGSLLGLEVALLAINTTARTALLGKLKDLGDGAKGSFRKTAAAMSDALREQVILIAVSGVALMFLGAPVVVANYVGYLVTSSILVASLIASIQIVYDTGMAIMVILEEQSRA